MRSKETKKLTNELFRFARSARHLGVALLLPAVCLPTAARGQGALSVDSLATQPSHSYPHLQKRREAILSAVGVGLLVTGLVVPANELEVPLQGFDPGEISWSADRDIVGNHSRGANRISDWTREASLIFPLALALATGQEGERWHSFSHSSLVFAKTILMSQGLTWLGKTTFDFGEGTGIGGRFSCPRQPPGPRSRPCGILRRPKFDSRAAAR